MWNDVYQMKRLKPLTPYKLTPLSRLKPIYDEGDGLEASIGSTEEYKKSACKALGVPYEKDTRRVYHHVGYFRPIDIREAINAYVVVYLQQREPSNNIYDYDEYLESAKNIKGLRKEIEGYKKFQLEERYRWDEYQSRYDDWLEKDPEKRGSAPHWRNKASPIPPEDRDAAFVAVFDRRQHTIDLEGFASYLVLFAPDLYSMVVEELPLYIEENPDKPHGYILGTPGSGKSELIKTLVHTYVTHKKYGSVVIIDPTSELVEPIAKWKEFNTGNRLVYIRPTLAKGVHPALNPFEIHDVSPTDYSEEALNTKRVVAQELVEALARIVAESSGHISGPMEIVLTNCVLVLLDRKDSTLRDLARFMRTKDNKDLIDFARSLKHHEYCKDYWDKDGFNAPNNTQTRQAIGRRLGGLLDVGTFARFTCGKSTINLQELLDHRKVVLFDLGKGAIGKKEGRAIGQLVMALMLGIAYRRESQSIEARVPISMIVDECHNFVTRAMEDMLFETRKYRLLLTLAQQTVGQRMPLEIKDAVLNATNLQIVGGTPLSGAKRNADLLGVDPGDVRNLEIGEFYVRPSRTKSVIKFRGRTDLLGDKNTVTKLSWNRIKKGQIEKYYQPNDEVIVQTPEDEEIDTRPQPRNRK